MESWKDYFEKRILDRGRSYYNNGAVQNLRKTAEGYEAYVSGTVRYEVEIEMENGKVEYMSCDCPYADSGENCKHMAAVMYAIEKQENGTIETNGKSGRKKQTAKENLQDIVDSIPEAELRDYVYNLAKDNKSIENYIRINYGSSIDAEYMKNLKKDLRAIIRRYSDDGFIAWEDAFDYISDVEAFMKTNIESMIDKNFLVEAFELTNYVLDKITNQPMDDSDGGIVAFAGDCKDYWLEIMEKADDKSKDKMFRWFNNKLLKHQLDDFIEDVVYEFIMKNFAEEKYLEKKLALFDEFIKEDKFSYNYSKYIGEKLKIMQKLNYPAEQINLYKERYWKLPEIRKVVFDEYIAQEEWQKALEILEESKKLDEDNYLFMARYRKNLIELYKKVGNKKAYRKELTEFIFDSCGSDLSLIYELREDCTPEEWLSYREKILAGEMLRETKLELLEKEGMYEELWQEIFERAELYEIDRYEKVLKKIFPERMLDLYVDYIRKNQMKVSNREEYSDLIKYLKKVTLYSGGEKKAQEIAANWRDVFKRRRAMMDELNKAGF